MDFKRDGPLLSSLFQSKPHFFHKLLWRLLASWAFKGSWPSGQLPFFFFFMDFVSGSTADIKITILFWTDFLNHWQISPLANARASPKLLTRKQLCNIDLRQRFNSSKKTDVFIDSSNLESMWFIRRIFLFISPISKPAANLKLNGLTAFLHWFKRLFSDSGSVSWTYAM